VRAIFLAAFICLAFLSLQPRGNGQGNSARPKPAPTPQPTPSKPKTIVSGGVLNGKAISKPQPSYPPIAKAAKASGTVTVRVLVSEEGNVISARAVSGHPLLRRAALDAAYQAKFPPAIVSGQKVQVSGVLTYDFVFKR
jgi:periplasmic protein TonB